MHFHLPKPLHGWREFVGEVGIIVIGVLIALGAEQVVESLHWRNQLRQFDAAMDAEVASDLATYQYRLKQEGCVARRIGELERWRASARDGAVPPLAVEIGRPSVLTIKDTVWQTHGDAMAHMPLDRRLNYADIYNLYETTRDELIEERDVWRGLAAFNHVGTITPDGLLRLNELLYRAKSVDWILRANWQQAADRAAKLGVRPDFGSSRKYIPPPDPEFCRPLLSAPAAK